MSASQVKELKINDYKILDYANDKKLLFDVETNSLFSIPASTGERLASGKLTQEENNELCYIQDHGYFSPFNKDSLERASWLDGENLAINVNLTFKCNMACIYCFAQGGDYGLNMNDSMGDDILEGLEQFIINKVTKTNKVRIEFFGGEPLLNMKMIENVYRVCEKINKTKGIEFIYRISTNLTVLPEKMFDIMKEGRFIISVSIDGGAYTHNKNRPGKNGEVYFNNIINNCKKLRQGSDEIVLVARMTVYDNEISLLKNIDELLMYNIFDYFQIFLAFIPESLSEKQKNNQTLWRDNKIGYSTPDKVKLEFEMLIKNYFNFFDKNNRFQGNLEFERIADMIINKKIAIDYCSAGRNYYTVSPDKSVVPCHRLVGNERFLSGYINDKKIQQPSGWRENVLSKPQCKNCWIRYLCAGGCKQQNYLGTGDINKLDVKFCKNEQDSIQKLLVGIAGQSNEYHERDRSLLNKMFVSCGRPVIKSLCETEKLNEEKIKYFKPLL